MTMSHDYRTGGVPDLIPARMLNEWVYCPRLAYLEWVQREWAGSVDTIEGSFGHRRVDRETGDTGKFIVDGEMASSDDGRQKATSVELSSERLGLIARMDCIEFDGACACPVDHKRGSPPPERGQVWDSDRIQLGAQALLLREAGYRCEYGYVYYIESKSKVPVPIDARMEESVLAAVAQLRAAAESGRIPDPLVDSPDRKSVV